MQQAVRRIAGELEPGDLFLLHYSGHGSQIPDTVGSTEEVDKLDETWCLHNAEMLDDELRRLWTCFKKDVRIIIISDSCHSGGVSKGDLEEPASRDIGGGAAVVPRELPKEDRDFTYRNNQAAYDDLQRAVNQNIPGSDELVATIVLLAACRDDETAKDDGQHGVFTRALLGVHRQGKFRQDNYTHMQLGTDITSQIPANYKQHPRMTALDRPDLPISFGLQKPFAISES
ncbi:MAG: caspase family protein [Singulisphaera sp.]